jgi:tetratricopeptide (TPR) repeat protein
MRRRISACALTLLISLTQVATAHAADTGSPVAPTPTPTPTPVVTTVEVDELALSRTLIAAKNYRAALVELKRVDRIVMNNADVSNLLGFASRKLAQYSQAGAYYVKALKIDPNHLGALEYQGELFLIQKKVSLANQNLAKLKKLCGTSCEEYLDLKQAIAKKKK